MSPLAPTRDYLAESAARRAAATPPELLAARQAYYDACRVASITHASTDYRERARCKQAYELEQAKHESGCYRVTGEAYLFQRLP